MSLLSSSAMCLCSAVFKSMDHENLGETWWYFKFDRTADYKLDSNLFFLFIFTCGIPLILMEVWVMFVGRYLYSWLVNVAKISQMSQGNRSIGPKAVNFQLNRMTLNGLAHISVEAGP